MVSSCNIDQNIMLKIIIIYLTCEVHFSTGQIP